MAGRLPLALGLQQHVQPAPFQLRQCPGLGIGAGLKFQPRGEGRGRARAARLEHGLQRQGLTMPLIGLDASAQRGPLQGGPPLARLQALDEPVAFPPLFLPLTLTLHLPAWPTRQQLWGLPSRFGVLHGGLQVRERQALGVKRARQTIVQTHLQLPAGGVWRHVHLAIDQGVRCRGPQRGQINALQLHLQCDERWCALQLQLALRIQLWALAKRRREVDLQLLACIRASQWAMQTRMRLQGRASACSALGQGQFPSQFGIELQGVLGLHADLTAVEPLRPSQAMNLQPVLEAIKGVVPLKLGCFGNGLPAQPIDLPNHLGVPRQSQRCERGRGGIGSRIAHLQLPHTQGVQRQLAVKQSSQVQSQHHLVRRNRQPLLLPDQPVHMTALAQVATDTVAVQLHACRHEVASQVEAAGQ